MILDAFPYLLGTSFILVGVAHEYKWRQRLRHGGVVRGKIVKMVEQTDSWHPEIEYEFEGRLHYFVSKYSGGVVGAAMPVVINDETGDAEALTWSNRWLFTIVPLLFGGGLLFVLQYS